MWIDGVRGLLPMGHVEPQAKSKRGERSVPLPLGLVTNRRYRILANTFCGLIRLMAATCFSLTDSFCGLIRMKAASYYALAVFHDGSKAKGS
jgi:hypothetical protein